jgi:hypothetical protein
MTYVLMSGPDVIGTGPTTKTCRTCGPTGRALGGFDARAIADPSGEWAALEFTSPESARAFLANRPGRFTTYAPVPLSALHLCAGLA